ncbi:MAG: hypothetical protein HYU29_02620 [Chloroflexi bacterium]|nr:hypothetical protein [Chloroflexota bacterium]
MPGRSWPCFSRKGVLVGFSTGAWRPGGRVWKAVLIVGLAVAIMGLLDACAVGPAPGNPMFPPGFAEAALPDVEVRGYLYVVPPRPLPVNVGQFVKGGARRSGEGDHVALRRAILWAGMTADQFGARVELSGAGEAQLVRSLIEESGEARALWLDVREDTLTLAGGAGPWVDSLKESLARGGGVSLQTKDPEVWQLLRLLPETPPMRPVAAGFVLLERGLIEMVAETIGVDSSPVIDALSSARVEVAAFAVYSEVPVAVPQKLDMEFIRDLGAEAVVVTRSGYPSFILGIFFDSAIKGSNMERYDLEGDTVYHTVLDGEIHLIVRRWGNVIYAAVAPAKEKAERLMISLRK